MKFIKPQEYILEKKNCVYVTNIWSFFGLYQLATHIILYFQLLHMTDCVLFFFLFFLMKGSILIFIQITGGAS
jgi:hypothetical protein